MRYSYVKAVSRFLSDIRTTPCRIVNLNRIDTDREARPINADKSERIYLDFNATTPIALEVAAAIVRFLAEPFGNPTSNHWTGLAAHATVEQARNRVAGLLHCSPEEIVFTATGSEATISP
jgi:selenocysteine lyase/cysteine desulfurase